jgi:hypothetical protein
VLNGTLNNISVISCGRIKSPFPKGERHYIQLDDGATMTYHVFEPFVSHPKGTVYKLEKKDIG